MQDNWKPKIGKKYYYFVVGHIRSGVHKAIWENSDVDLARYNEQNCFRSMKTAEFIYKSFNRI